jgi:L-rhamnose-H+ transport protein
VAICLAGIGLCGYAGIRKERELSNEQCREGVKEFALGKGFIVATFSGIMSAGFAYGINAGKPVADIALQMGSADIFKNSPVFILVMAGGFTVNCIWCLILNIKNKTGGDYRTGKRATLLANYLYSAAAGVIWYTGFFFYGMGTTKMGQYDFSSWSIHLAFVIAFSTLCGIMLKEWKGVKRKTFGLVVTAILVMVVSTIITATGNYIASQGAQ